jgi:hypothetical protein
MSHASKQIRDWFIAACTGVAGLPNAEESAPSQIGVEVDACYITTPNETLEQVGINSPPVDLRVLTVNVGLLAGTYSEVDQLSLLAEHAIFNKAAYPGKDLIFVQREYEENTDTDRAYVSLVLTYSARYFVARNAVDSFQ